MTHNEKVTAVLKCLGEKHFSRINEKSDEQLDYVLSSIAEYIFLQACPGSGKTEVVGLKAAYEIQKWERKPSGIAIITFTNSAADVISERVTQFADNNKTSYPHFIGTIDSWLHGYIAQPFLNEMIQTKGKEGDYSIKVIENNLERDFLYSFKTTYGLNKTGSVLANQFYYNDLDTKKITFKSGNQAKDRIRNSSLLEDYQIVELKKAKVKFWKANYATHQDIEFLCLILFNKNNSLVKRLASRFPLILIDECQDLSSIQLNLFSKLKQAGSIIHLIGDLQQSIYEFKKVDPVNIENFINKNRYAKKFLTANYRSGQRIVDTCTKLVGGMSINGKEKELFPETCVYFIYKKEEISNLVEVFQKYIESNKIQLGKSVIITRSWNNVYRIRNMKPDENDRYQFQLAMAIYLWQKKERVSMEEAIRLLCKFISKKYFNNYSANSRQYYCPECVKSAINWRIFLANILNAIYKSEGSIKNQNQIWSNWSKTIKSELMTITKNCIAILNESVSLDVIKKIDLNECKFQAPKGEAANNVLNSLIISETTSIEVLITTIHSVKGQTFDAVLVVSSPSKVGTSDGHWSDWLENPKSEAARLAYVASSRPKYLLAWAIPEPNEEEIKKLESIGFKSFNN